MPIYEDFREIWDIHKYILIKKKSTFIISLKINVGYHHKYENTQNKVEYFPYRSNQIYGEKKKHSKKAINFGLWYSLSQISFRTFELFELLSQKIQEKLKIWNSHWNLKLVKNTVFSYCI